MKKLIGALALAAMVATSAFAEVSFGAWLCTLPTLIGSDGDGIKGGGISNPWGWASRPARMDINWTSDDGKAGMIMGLYCNQNGSSMSFGGSDAQELWIKPIDQIKIHVGQMDNFAGTMGGVTYGSWNWLRPNTGVDGFWGENMTFSKLNDAGIGLQIFPVEALQIFASLPLTAVSKGEDNVLGRMDKVFGKGKIGAAYTIDGIGTIKAQFLGQYDKKDANASTVAKGNIYTVKDGIYTDLGGGTTAEMANAELAVKKGDADSWGYATDAIPATPASTKYGTFEAAFDLTGIDKLFATVGFAFTATDNSKDNNMKIALGGSYGITEAFKLAADFALNIPGDSDKKPTASFGVGLDYALTDALGLTADVRMLMPFDTDNAGSKLSFLVGAQYAVGSNASLGLGFQAVVGLSDKSGAGNLKVVNAATVDNEVKKFIFAVPVRASIWF